VAQAQEGEIRSQALAVLTLQDGIIDGFRKKNGNGSANGRGTAENTVPAQLLAVGATETRFGRRLFISVKVNGKTLKLFGSDKQLADAVASAGYPDRTDLVEEGAALQPALPGDNQAERGREVPERRARLPRRSTAALKERPHMLRTIHADREDRAAPQGAPYLSHSE